MVSLSSHVTTIALAERLQSALPKFYATVLVFAVKAKMYFIPSITSKLVPAFATENLAGLTFS